ncbi:hypothetical protein [Rubrivirga sp.]|uniref:hypothetical protein n=1 Tax=Rubrivirga sp. TaxID=1885344 RepID=UPI003B52DA39
MTTLASVVFAVWLAVGVVASVRAEVAKADREGRRRGLAAWIGLVLAIGAEWVVIAIAVVAAALWSVVT